MRLWHKDLIPVLPRQQLLAQWRECCCIAANLAKNGTPNHLLVNKILDYPPIHFEMYCNKVYDEMVRRGYKVNPNVHERLMHNILYASNAEIFNRNKIGTLYDDWHNDRYYWQCYLNLQEKYDCGGITPQEWYTIKSGSMNLISIEYDKTPTYFGEYNDTGLDEDNGEWVDVAELLGGLIDE